MDIGYWICESCGTCSKVILDEHQVQKITNCSTPVESSYKRSQHFSNRLDFLQAKKHIDIDPRDLNRIIDEIEFRRLLPEDLTCETMRKILKDLSLDKHYYNIPYILHIIIVKKPPKISPETEQVLHHIFKRVEAAFNKYCPPDRVNFTNYAYTKRKILEALGFNELAEMLPLPKQEDRLIWHDEIWKKISAEVGLEWRPSI